MAKTYSTEIDGGTLARGFWLYVWEVTTPDKEILLYVGRTGDNSTPNAQSPFNRMGQHLGNAKNSSMLRNHLGKHGIEPNSCRFRLIAYGPILEEVSGHDMDAHKERRDIIGALEKQLCDELTDAGYDVMNEVRWKPPLDESLYQPAYEAFADHFPKLQGTDEHKKPRRSTW